MRAELPEPLRELAAFQHGLLTSRQALAGGLSRDVVRSELEQGRWQRLYTGVYAAFTGPPGRPAVLWAAVLRAGPGAMLSYHTAAEVTGLADRESSRLHVTLPAERRITSMPGVTVHLSDRAAQARHPSATPPRTTVEETVLDLVGVARTADDAYGWATRAIGRRLTTQARLRDAMVQRTRLRWRRDLEQALAPDHGGVHSSLEYRYLRDVERPHGLPPGVRQARARRGARPEYRDVLYEAYAVVVELDGHIAHPADTRWSDIYRDNAAAPAGLTTLRYGWPDVTRHPCVVAAQVAELLQRRGYTGHRACGAGCLVAAVRPPAARPPAASPPAAQLAAPSDQAVRRLARSASPGPRPPGRRSA
jgi:hypothetical protein